MLCYNIATHISFTDPCESSPCKNGGKCNSENGEWKCDCTSQYFGLNCENKRNPCQYIKCLNGGTCVPTSDNAISCSCQSGFQGAFCKEKQDKKVKEEAELMRGKSKQQQKPIYGSFQSSHFLSKIRHCCEILNGGMTNK